MRGVLGHVKWPALVQVSTASALGRRWPCFKPPQEVRTCAGQRYCAKRETAVRDERATSLCRRSVFAARLAACQYCGSTAVCLANTACRKPEEPSLIAHWPPCSCFPLFSCVRLCLPVLACICL